MDVAFESAVSVGDLIVARGRLTDSDTPVYFVEQAGSDASALAHPALPAIRGEVEYDGRSYWVIEPPDGMALPDLLPSLGGAPEYALERVRQLAEGALHVAEAGLCPGDFYRHVYWTPDGLVLDYPGALLDEGDASFPQVAEAGDDAIVVTLAAVWHGCVTGKAATDPPYVFLPPSGEATMAADAEALLKEGLAGAVTLPAFIERLAYLEAEERLSRALPPLVSPASPPVGVRTEQRLQTRRKALDWILWILSFALGLYLLITCEIPVTD